MRPSGNSPEPPLETDLDGEGADNDPLTPQRRGFIDTFFSPWVTLRSVLTPDKTRYPHCRRVSGTRCPASAGSGKRRRRQAASASSSGDETNASDTGSTSSPFGCLKEVMEEAKGQQQYHPRRACADSWFRWALGVCKCRPPGSRVPRRRRRGAPVLLRLAVHQEVGVTSTNVTTPGGDRYLSNGWRLSPACGRAPDQGKIRGLEGPAPSPLTQDTTSEGHREQDLRTNLQHQEPTVTSVSECLNEQTPNQTELLENQRNNGSLLQGDNIPPKAPLCGSCLRNDSFRTVADELAQATLDTCSAECEKSKQGLPGYPALRLVQECRRRHLHRPNTERARRSAKHLANYLVVPAMLQQILKDMYIDPELLAELDDEQKQILFCKLREEQVRRWKEREDKLEQEEKKRSKKQKLPGKNGKRHIGWLQGSDNEVWVWVMGEHENDRSIEQILEEQAQEQARKLAEKEAEALAKRQEEELQRHLLEEKHRLEEEARRRQADLRKKAELDRIEEERKKHELEEQEQMKLLRVKHEQKRRRSIDEINQLKERRSSEIYMSYKETRQTIEKLAEEDSKALESEWQEQEKKSKAAEEEIRAIARRAREEHRRSMTDTLRSRAQVIGKMAAGLQDVRADKPPVPTKPASLKLGRPPKPSSRKAIIDWYKEVEYPKGTGVSSTTKQVEPWFHGIITRQDAEVLLETEPSGTFLVRVSERIWGYAVSYRGPVRCKHFLIDAGSGNYQFFGTHQIAHASLADLVNFHKVTPISNSGQEKLLRPCKQKQDPPNYHDLIPAMNLITL